jgi:rod shape-determining protein MreD
MTSGLILFLLGFFVTLQDCLLPFGYLPFDFLLLFVIFIGLQRGEVAGAWVGLLAGFCMDLVAGPPHLGVFTLSKCLAGAAAGLLGRLAFPERWRTQVLAGAGLTLVHEGVAAWSGRKLGLAQGGLWQVLGAFVGPKIVLHGLAALPFFWLMQKVVRRRIIQNKLMAAPKVIKSTLRGDIRGY